MKYKDWSNFAVHCSGIEEILSRPKFCTDLTKSQKETYDKLVSMAALEELDDKGIERLLKLTTKKERYNNPELSQTCIKYLLKRYAWEKYNKKSAALSSGYSTVNKGNQLEDEGAELLSKHHKVKYIKPNSSCQNEYILGRCDLHTENKKVIVDIKTSWSIYSFLPNQVVKLDKRYWLQMQGYLDIYNADYGKVCYVLLNTPPHLVERERAKYTEKYVFGEITKERYEEEIEKFDLSFSYDKIPLKRRIIEFEVKRCPEIFPIIYKRVEKCREWMNEFERLHLSSKKILTLAEHYVGEPKEDNIEFDSTESC